MSFLSGDFTLESFMEVFTFSVYIKLQTEFVAFSQLYLSSNQLINSIELDKPLERPR